ncbi:MAG TPA: phosphatase PAP2 family protein [Solirubrobacterales bacterium]|nr:phosphatase PAP2 family protein [Solirubrobacterales bacterium]
MPLSVRRLVFLAFACAGGVGLFALFFYGSDRFNHYDTTLTSRLLAPHGSSSERAAEFAANSANLGPLLLIFAGIAILAIVWRRPWHLLVATAVFVGANLTTQALKVMLAHPRLQGALGASYPVQIAYPSGHATAAISAGFALWLVAPPRWRALAALVGGAYALVVAVGVVLAGWHFISDVFGAMLVVGFWAFLGLAALVLGRQEAPRDWVPGRGESSVVLPK